MVTLEERVYEIIPESGCTDVAVPYVEAVFSGYTFWHRSYNTQHQISQTRADLTMELSADPLADWWCWIPTPL